MLIMPESNLKVTQNGNNSIQKENCIKADFAQRYESHGGK